MECVSPEVNDNTAISPEQAVYIYQDTVAYSCNEGYEHDSSETTRTCQEDRTWSGTALECFGKLTIMN